MWNITGGSAIPGAVVGILMGGYCLRQFQLTRRGEASLSLNSYHWNISANCAFIFLGPKKSLNRMSIEQASSKWSFTSHLTHNNSSFRRRFFPGDHLHWQWDLRFKSDENLWSNICGILKIELLLFVAAYLFSTFNLEHSGWFFNAILYSLTSVLLVYANANILITRRKFNPLDLLGA